MAMQLFICLMCLVVLHADLREARKFTQTSRPAEFSINLDDAPEDRWGHVIKQYPGITSEIRNFIMKYVPSFIVPIIEEIGANLHKYLPSIYAREIRGMAKSANVSVGDFVWPNIIYDLTAFCTSIVAEDKKGTLWHARNLDYGLDVQFSNWLRNITVTLHFTKNGKHLYSATSYVGYVGILTAQKPHAFTVSIDQRDSGSWWMNALMAILDRNAHIMSLLVRDTLEQAPDFAAAVNMLAKTPTIAPVYFIVGGAKESQAAVITKDRLSARDIWYMDTVHKHWYLVETNYDHWVPAPKHDDRRDAAIHRLNATGRAGISTASLLKILSIPPVLQQSTTYTTVMSAMKPEVFATFVQHPNKDVKDTITHHKFNL